MKTFIVSLLTFFLINTQFVFAAQLNDRIKSYNLNSKNVNYYISKFQHSHQWNFVSKYLEQNKQKPLPQIKVAGKKMYYLKSGNTTVQFSPQMATQGKVYVGIKPVTYTNQLNADLLSQISKTINDEEAAMAMMILIADGIIKLTTPMITNDSEFIKNLKKYNAERTRPESLASVFQSKADGEYFKSLLKKSGLKELPAISKTSKDVYVLDLDPRTGDKMYFTESSIQKGILKINNKVFNFGSVKSAKEISDMIEKEMNKVSKKSKGSKLSAFVRLIGELIIADSNAYDDSVYDSTPATPESSGPDYMKWLKWGAIGVGVLGVLGAGAYLISKKSGGSAGSGAGCIKMGGSGVQSHTIKTSLNGRPTVGDLNNDGTPDLVLSNGGKIAAYTVCGDTLWDVQADTNWIYPGHYFWNFTTYGFVGDADGDKKAEFLHIASDWQTLQVRDGATGAVKKSIPLPGGKQWMYVLLAQREGDGPESSTRIITTTASYDSDVNIASIDMRGGEPKVEWVFQKDIGGGGMFVYLPPQVVNLDEAGDDEIVFGSIALKPTGEQIWLADASGVTGGRGFHATTVKDIDPSKPGLEAVYSLYAPDDGAPSIIAHGVSSGGQRLFETPSPHANKHPHQHAVGDFDTKSPGLEILVRNGDGINHWMTDSQGKVLKQNWRIDPGAGWNSEGDSVMTIDWDDSEGDEILYLERLISSTPRGQKSKLAVVSPSAEKIIAGPFSGEAAEEIKDWLVVDGDPFFNPYEGTVMVVDMFGDGKEEIVTWGNSSFTIYYNPSSGDVKKKWGDPQYEKFKKVSCPMYSPR